jgi:serine/threonine protein kinase
LISDIGVNHEPLPGYRLIDRIGAGGYGEVWRAEAPGGLAKAIKFVFGKPDDRRATNELRALERIRDVRHPFLLSLERIEVIDSRLVVVMELAHGSVKDRFEACRQLGLPGIPREELLGYLRDAADALDFMSDEHSLQHLDIKPENLLLQAGHVKVADFGLVKDVQEREASLVGGMTPLYAAPEVFQGAPTRHSDQYSLAIVYQDMLTGTLPFAGRNAAELTLQHLHEEPDLSSLSAADRYVVARALAKDPRHRYATCREFVEALTRASTRASVLPSESSWEERSSAPARSTDATARQTSQTESFDQQCVRGSVGAQSPRFTLPLSSGTIADLSPIDVQQQQFEPLPTLFLGIGGIAGRVLNHLRQTMYDRFGTAVIPAMPMLWLDSDPTELAKRGERARLSGDETLALPLRRPSHYRDRSQQLLQWLNRRWLYNIPRSFRTEGLRPLGRLALVDQARQTGQRIRRAVIDAIDAGAIHVSSQALGRAFRSGDAQVYVVASISGGTGSGMAIDIGYLVRAVLDALELPHAKVLGIMLHATGRDANDSELARVNAFSWLTELHHYQQTTSVYLNDGSCCLPTHAPGVPPFDLTYLVHLGDDLGMRELDDAAALVADYLELDSLTAARPFFDACRNPSSGDVSGPTTSLRSFGMFHTPAMAADVCDELAAAISRRTVMDWRGLGDGAGATGYASAVRPEDTGRASATQPRADVSKVPEEVAADDGHLVERLHLEPAAITTLAQALLEAELGADPPTFVASWLASRDHRPSERLATIDRVFEASETAADGDNAVCGSSAPAPMARSGDRPQQQSTLLGRPAASIVRPLAEKLSSEVRRWVIQHLDTPGKRLPAARRAATWLCHYLEAAEQHIQALRRNIAAQLLVLRSAPTAQTSTPEDEDRAIRYFQLRLHQLALVAARQMIGLIISDLKTVMDGLAIFGDRLAQFQAALAEPSDGRSGDSASTQSGTGYETLPDLAASVPRQRLAELSAEVDRRLQTEYLAQRKGLFATVMHGGRDRAQLLATLHGYARQAVEHTWAGMHAFGTAVGSAEPDSVLSAGLKSATPRLLEHGGTRRVLMVVPRDAVGNAGQADVARLVGTDVSLVAGSDNNLTMCVEVDGLSLPYIAADIIRYRQDLKELADRVHSRTDVAWTPLVPTATQLIDAPTTGMPSVLMADAHPQAEPI